MTMTIPKKRDYRLLATVVACGVLLSSLLIVLNGILAQALTVPHAFKSLKPFSQNWSSQQSNKRANDNSRRERVVETTKPAASPSPSPVTAPADKQPAAKPTRSTPAQAVALRQADESETSPQKPADTSAAVRTVAANQSDKPTKPVQYESAQISTSERDKLYKGSLVVAATGASLYIGSYAAAVWRWARKDQMGVRRTITQ